MKKITSIFLFILISALSLTSVSALPKKSQMLPAFSSISDSQDRIWVGTFQLVWNDFMDEVVKGPINFKNGTPKDALLLNRQEFKKSMLSDDSYYTAWGRTNLELKSKIEKDLWDKFQEKSVVLDKIDWNDPFNAYLFYAMLKKDFKFHTKFEILDKEKFGNKKTEIPYFGLDKESPAYLYNGVDVLFYNNPFDYAVALKSDNDKVILYRTNDNKSFDRLFSDLQKKSQKYKGNKKFVSGDQLKVPYMTINQQTEFPELCKKEILTTNLYIDKAIQTVEFNMTRRGVKLKSEAVIDANFMSMPIKTRERGRNFFFNNTFVLFMKETNKNVPYFALRVKDMDLYKYTGEVD